MIMRHVLGAILENIDTVFPSQNRRVRQRRQQQHSARPQAAAISARVQGLEKRTLLTAPLEHINVFPGGGPWSTEMISLGDELLYVDGDEQHGLELRRLDPVTNTSELFVDVNPGPFDSLPRDMLLADGKLFFVATDRTVGEELRWIDLSDDTRTVHTVDVIAGVRAAAPQTLRHANGKLFFFATDTDDDYRQQLHWLNTSSPEVVHTIPSVYRAVSDSYVPPPARMTLIGDHLYFAGSLPDIHEELLWIDTSSEAPVVQSYDIEPAFSSQPGFQTGFATDGRWLGFWATDSTNGPKMRLFDTHTQTLVTVPYAPNGGYFDEVDFVAGKLVFRDNSGIHWVDLDQPTEGHTLEFPTFTRPEEMVPLGPRLYFGLRSTSGNEMHWIDFEEETPSLESWDVYPGPASSYPGAITVVDDRLFFVDTSSVRSISLDGTQVSYISEGLARTAARSLLITEDRLFGLGTGGDGGVLFHADLDAATTASFSVNLRSESSGLSGGYLDQFDGDLYFVGQPMELLRVRNVAGQRQIEHLSMDAEGIQSLHLESSERYLLGSAQTISGAQLWLLEVDGTSASYRAVEPGESPNEDSILSIPQFVIHGDFVVFTTYKSSGEELWIADLRDPSLTAQLVPRQPDTQGTIRIMKAIGSRIYFIENHPSEQRLVWLDTAEITAGLNDVVPGPGQITGRIRSLEEGDDFAYLQVDHSDGSRRLIFLEDAPDGGAKAVPIESNITSPILEGRKLLFFKWDETFGTELREFDPETGQLNLFDLTPGRISTHARVLATSGSRVLLSFLNSQDPQDYLQWVDLSDPDYPREPVPINMYGRPDVEAATLIGSRLYFWADDGIIGSELRWIDAYDTSNTVHTVTDLSEGVTSSRVQSPTVTVIDTNLYFSASRPGYGHDLYRLDVSAAWDGLAGNVDRDTDFDANDSFLTHTVMLAGSNTQIDQSKGASRSSAAEIRDRITALHATGDVDGDGDFDANDSFLIHLVQLAGSDAQIDQSKGPSPLTAAEIRERIGNLGQFGTTTEEGGNSGQSFNASDAGVGASGGEILKASRGAQPVTQAAIPPAAAATDDSPQTIAIPVTSASGSDFDRDDLQPWFFADNDTQPAIDAVHSDDSLRTWLDQLRS